MGTVPTWPTLVAGTKLTAAHMASIKDVMDFWSNPPRFQGAGSNSAGSGTPTLIQYTSERIDVVQSGDSGMHPTDVSAVYVRTAGWYLFSAYAQFDRTVTAGSRTAEVLLNGSTLSVTVEDGGQSMVVVRPMERQLAVGDMLQLQVTQTSGSSMTVAGMFDIRMTGA